jgi:hypothetical protein
MRYQQQICFVLFVGKFEFVETAARGKSQGVSLLRFVVIVVAKRG